MTQPKIKTNTTAAYSGTPTIISKHIRRHIDLIQNINQVMHIKIMLVVVVLEDNTVIPLG